MNIYDVKVGTKLDFELVNSLGERIGQTYVSQLVEVLDREQILIACPIHESRLMLILAGTRSRMVFLHEKQGLISFTGSIAGKEKRENLVLLSVKIDGSFESIQRRKYFRLDCLLNAAYRVLPDAEKQDEQVPDDPCPARKAIVKNISGNGAGMVSDEELPKGVKLEVEIQLAAGSAIKVSANIVRCFPIEGVKTKKYDLGLYFTKISPRDQDLLVRFIFDQQRLLLKKSTGR